MRRPSLACQVDGCTADLAGLRSYFQRQHICEDHARADAIPDGYGGFLRFCQQCTKLEPLTAFEGTKRSCRASLAKRHMRRSGGRRATSTSDAHAARSYSSTDNGDATASLIGNLSQGGLAAMNFSTRAAAAATANGNVAGNGPNDRGSPTSAGSRQPAHTTRSGTSGAPPLAVLLEAALPPLGSEDAPRSAAAAAAAAGGLSQHQQGPAPLSLGDFKTGSSILDKVAQRQQPEGQLSGALRGAPRFGPTLGSTTLPAALAAAASNLQSGTPTEAQTNFLAAVLGGGAGGTSSPASVVNALTGRPSADTLGASSTNDLLPYLASVLSTRSSADLPPLPGRGPMATSRLAELTSQPQAAALLAELQQQQDLEQLLVALQMLQQLQGLIGSIVISQLQQQLVRAEASALLDQQLLPLLAAIQARQANNPSSQQGGEGAGGGVQQQLDHILGQLGQLVGVLQSAPPPAVAAQVLASQQPGGLTAAQQQALSQLAMQHLGRVGSGGSAGQPGSARAAAQGAAPANKPATSAPAALPQPKASSAAAAAGTDHLQALLQRISPMLKRQSELDRLRA